MLEHVFGTGWRRIVRVTKVKKSNRARVVARKGNIITPERAADLDRARRSLMKGRTFSDSSADLIREAREERTDQL
jgi:hypothetical protein